MSSDSRLEANKIHGTYRASLLQLAEAMAPHDFLHQEVSELRAIADNLQAPFNIAVFGRMKTGKSTLINALIGKQLAITGVEEATATINRISYATGDRLNQFTVHWQDRQPEMFPLERLQQDWNGKSPEVLERVSKAAWLEIYSDAPSLRDIHITDTPGTGATAAEHETIAKQFINGQDADALLYVFSPTGRESDEADLASFRAGCLPGSSLDNSLAILHKWDHIYWDEDNWESILTKAGRVHRFMQELVSDVIPVSAPIALLAKTAPDCFWNRCLVFFKQFDKEVTFLEVLGDQDEWEDYEALEALYRDAKQLGCPLPSFRVTLRHLYRQPATDASECRKLVLELSGIEKLERTLDRQIFSMRSVIQQKQNCARARRVMSRVYNLIEKEQARRQRDLVTMKNIMSMIPDEAHAEKLWLENRMEETRLSYDQLHSDYRELDWRRIRVAEWSDTITAALDLLPWLADVPADILDDVRKKQMKMLLQSLIPSVSSDCRLDIKEAFQLQRTINLLSLCPSVEYKHKAEQLRQCLMTWMSQRSPVS